MSDLNPRMQWVITNDKIAEPGDLIPDSTGHGFLDDHPTKEHRVLFLGLVTANLLKTILPWRFRLFDDDDELYYEGRANSFDYDESQAFTPLDWAMPHAGCTYMMIRGPDDTEWSQL